MKKFANLAAATAILAAAGFNGSALAAGGVSVPNYDWSFEGTFGTYDQMQLQRGWQVYSQICAACHSLQYLRFRNLGEPGGPEFPEEQVEAIAAQFLAIDEDIAATLPFDSADAQRPALPRDPIMGAFLTREAAEATFGVAVPDLSLIVKARSGFSGTFYTLFNGGGGPEYVYALLTGYPDEPPEDWELGAGLHFNEYFSGHQIAMAAPLWDGAVEYVVYEIDDDGVVHTSPGPEATVEQMSADVTAFLMWSAEPHLEARKEAGVRNLIILCIFAVLLWYSNKKLWKRVKNGENA